MAEFVSSFITGFQDVIEKDLVSRIKGVKILKVFDGLIYYSYNGNSRDLDKILYFNNTFFVLKTWSSQNVNFSLMVSNICSKKSVFLISKGSFRVRFVQENQFAKVDKNISRKAEDYVLANSKLKLDRVNPSTEIWYSIRREGFAFCGQLLSKREFTEKNLNKGELRPEVAYLICSFAQLPENAVVAEPFCGYGSIPVQMIKKFKVSKLFVSDIDEEKIKLVKEKKQFIDNPAVDVRKCDAFALNHIENNFLDAVVTDPPWGFYEDIGDIKDFYRKMFDCILPKLKTSGFMVILTARKEELETVCEEKTLKIESSLHTLVNGKKAGLYKISVN